MTIPLAAFIAALAAPALAAGDHDTWVAAKHAAAKHHVSPVLLVAIRLHENPLRRNDYKACGVKHPKGGWWPGGLQGQMNKCADIVARYAKRHGWNPRKPTKQQVSDLGAFYAEGSRHWGLEVWSFYWRMHNARAELTD